MSGRVAAVGDDGVFEPEVEGEEGTEEGTPRWAQLIEALLDHGIDGACGAQGSGGSEHIVCLHLAIALEAGWRLWHASM